MTSVFTPHLVCRPALPKDTPEVIALTSLIWEGDDYVPYVWEDWLKDPQGLLAVAEFGGKIVGLCKLSQMAARDWWMQGLRVHPDFQGRGIASHLHDYVLDYWQRNGNGAVRLATSSIRLPVHHLCERTGFVKIGEYCLYTAPVINEKNGDSTWLAISDVSEALDYALQSPATELTFGLMDLMWIMVTPNAEDLGDAIQRERAWWWQRKTGLLVVIDDEDEVGPLPYIQLIACPVERIPEILQGYRRLASDLGFERAGWVAPLHPQLVPALEAAGFQPAWDHPIFLFEKRHRTD